MKKSKWYLIKDKSPPIGEDAVVCCTNRSIGIWTRTVLEQFSKILGSNTIFAIYYHIGRINAGVKLIFMKG